jgi:c(7)-type cytochrome triheme protein
MPGVPQGDGQVRRRIRGLRIEWVAALLVACALGSPLGHAAEYGDIAYKRKPEVQGTDDVPPAVFPHWVHRMQYKCTACHEEPFKMKAGANEVTMDLIQAGRSCGICHNGKAAFESNFDTCQRCHSKS